MLKRHGERVDHLKIDSCCNLELHFQEMKIFLLVFFLKQKNIAISEQRYIYEVNDQVVAQKCTYLDSFPYLFHTCDATYLIPHAYEVQSRE